MNWKVEYSSRARQDLRDIYEYIAYDLLTRDTASKQTGRIMKEIHSLEKMPLRCRLYDEEPWHSQGLRFFPVNHYLVFYLTNEAKHTVTVIRIMYGGRDISRQLSEAMEWAAPD